jgi:hypothetical protein
MSKYLKSVYLFKIEGSKIPDFPRLAGSDHPCQTEGVKRSE